MVRWEHKDAGEIHQGPYIFVTYLPRHHHLILDREVPGDRGIALAFHFGPTTTDYQDGIVRATADELRERLQQPVDPLPVHVLADEQDDSSISDPLQPVPFEYRRRGSSQGSEQMLIEAIAEHQESVGGERIKSLGLLDRRFGQSNEAVKTPRPWRY